MATPSTSTAAMRSHGLLTREVLGAGAMLCTFGEKASASIAVHICSNGGLTGGTL
jgi:hypothetical protein